MGTRSWRSPAAWWAQSFTLARASPQEAIRNRTELLLTFIPSYAQPWPTCPWSHGAEVTSKTWKLRRKSLQLLRERNTGSFPGEPSSRLSMKCTFGHTVGKKKNHQTPARLLSSRREALESLPSAVYFYIASIIQGVRKEFSPWWRDIYSP